MHLHLVAPRGLLAAVAAPLLLASVMPSQQFAEVAKSYLPRDRGYTHDYAAGDVDGDGDLDLVAAVDDVVFPAQSRLYLNDGSGHFRDATASNLPARLDHTMHVELADLDGDGDLDLVTGTWERQNRLYLNGGNGVFTDATAARMPVDTDATWSLCVVDIDGDGDRDLLFANSGPDKLYLNNGLGFFTDGSVARLPLSPHNTANIAVGDVDGDLDLDLFLTGVVGQSLLYLNTGGAVFADATATHLPALLADTSWGEFVDIDGDHDLDLAIGAWNRPFLLYANDGLGHFTDVSAARLPGGESCWNWRVVVADLDVDGDRDLLFPSVGKDFLYLNNGLGFFADASATHLPDDGDRTAGCVLADVDGDGDLDQVNANVEQDRLRLNVGNGRFVDVMPQALPPDSDDTRALLLGDVDGDQDLDLFLGNSGLVGEWQLQNRLYLNDGRGSFRDVTATHLPAREDETRAAAFGDIDGDGDLDLLVGNANEQDRLLRNDGSGRFTDVTATCLPADTALTTAVLLVDVDLDGDLDAVLATYGGQTRLYRNQWGTFTDATAGALPALLLPTRALAKGDIDNDGDQDLVLGNGLVGTCPDRLYRNQGGVFTDVTTAQFQVATNTTSCLAFGDVDGDGDLDLVRGASNTSFGAENTLCINNGSGVFSVRRSMPYLYDQTTALQLGDVDLDGDLDAVVAGFGSPTRLYLNDGSGNFSEGWQRMPDLEQELMSLVLGDLDRDGDLDAVCGAAGWSGWQKNVYWNHHRQVRANELPRMGASFCTEFWARPGYATASELVLPLFGFGLAAPPLATPYGLLHLQPAGIVQMPLQVVPAPGGAATLVLALPVVPGLLGLQLHTQALFFGASELRLSNVTSDVMIH